MEVKVKPVLGCCVVRFLVGQSPLKSNAKILVDDGIVPEMQTCDPKDPQNLGY